MLFSKTSTTCLEPHRPTGFVRCVVYCDCVSGWSIVTEREERGEVKVPPTQWLCTWFPQRTLSLPLYSPTVFVLRCLKQGTFCTIFTRSSCVLIVLLLFFLFGVCVCGCVCFVLFFERSQSAFRFEIFRSTVSSVQFWSDQDGNNALKIPTCAHPSVSQKFLMCCLESSSSVWVTDSVLFAAFQCTSSSGSQFTP